MSEVTAEARHLFRALLRAASYLPDEFARTYIHGHIIFRFRNTSQITAARLQDARRAVRTLQKAADGEMNPLLKILNLAYGRSGKRRRELVDDLYAPERASLSKGDNAKQRPASDSIAREERQQKAHSQFDQFLLSSIRHHPPESSRPKIRGIRPQVPKENIWGRPMPVKRQKNIKQRFWAETLNRILPPLPESQWERLRDLVNGTIPYEPPPARRSRPRNLVDSQESVLHPSSLKRPVRSLKLPEAGYGATSPKHIFTPRFMRRMWAQVWNTSNTMVAPNEGSQRWNIVWGAARSALLNGHFAAPGNADLELFEGLGEDKQRPPRKAFYRAR